MSGWGHQRAIIQQVTIIQIRWRGTVVALGGDQRRKARVEAGLDGDFEDGGPQPSSHFGLAGGHGGEMRVRLLMEPQLHCHTDQGLLEHPDRFASDSGCLVIHSQQDS